MYDNTSKYIRKIIASPEREFQLLAMLCSLLHTLSDYYDIVAFTQPVRVVAKRGALWFPDLNEQAYWLALHGDFPEEDLSVMRWRDSIMLRTIDQELPWYRASRDSLITYLKMREPSVEVVGFVRNLIEDAVQGMVRNDYAVPLDFWRNYAYIPILGNHKGGGRPKGALSGVRKTLYKDGERRNKEQY